MKKQYLAQVLECVFKQVEEQFDQFCKTILSSTYHNRSDKHHLKLIIARDLAELKLNFYKYIKEEIIEHIKLYEKDECDIDVVNDTVISKEDIRACALEQKLQYSVAEHHPLKSDAIDDIYQCIEENLDGIISAAEAELYTSFGIDC